jgi:hypothetical protein
LFKWKCIIRDIYIIMISYGFLVKTLKLSEVGVYYLSIIKWSRYLFINNNIISNLLILVKVHRSSYCMNVIDLRIKTKIK